MVKLLRKIITILRVVIYIRVSSEMQVEGYSLQEQRAICREFAEAKGWEVLQVYEDEAESAKTDDRPQFQQMIAAAAQRQFDAIIVMRFDRFARNRRDMENYLHQLNEWGVEVFSVREQINQNTASGQAYLGMVSVFSQFYSDQLSENVTVSKAARAKKDKLWNSAIPFGYAVHYKKDGGDSRPYPDPQDAAGVQLAFEKYAIGQYSYNDIARVLNEAGYRPKGRGKRALPLFSKDTVEDILKNRFYLGEINYKGEWYPGIHEPLISAELFDACTAVRQRRSKRHGTTAPATSRVYILTGIGRCARCGEHLRGTYSSCSQRRYYRDPSRQKAGACDQRQIRADEAEAALGTFLGGLQLPENWQQQVLARVQAEFGNPREVAVEKQRLEKLLHRLKQLYLLDDLSEAEYLQQRTTAQAALAALTPPTLPDLERGAALLQDFGALWTAAEPAERRQLAHTLLNTVYLDADGDLVVALEPRPQFALLFQLLFTETASPVRILAAGTEWEEARKHWQS